MIRRSTRSTTATAAHPPAAPPDSTPPSKKRKIASSSTNTANGTDKGTDGRYQVGGTSTSNSQYGQGAGEAGVGLGTGAAIEAALIAQAESAQEVYNGGAVYDDDGRGSGSASSAGDMGGPGIGYGHDGHERDGLSGRTMSGISGPDSGMSKVSAPPLHIYTRYRPAITWRLVISHLRPPAARIAT